MPAKTYQQKKQAENNSNENGSDKIMSNAQKIVSSAVNVLEEEIAAGILAAKKFENKFINIEEVRSNEDELMNRIRRDTHEAVDLFLDAFAALTQQLNSVIDKDKKMKAQTSSEEVKSTAPISHTIILENDKALKAGESANFQMLLSDDEKDTKIALVKCDFTSTDNSIISRKNITITPSSIFLRPKENGEINIQVKIPANTASGFYRAILTDKFNPKIAIILSLQIEK